MFNFSNMSDGMIGLFQFTNDASEGILFPIFLICIFVIFTTAFILTWGLKNALAASATITFIAAILFRAMDVITDGVLMLTFIVFVIAALFLFIDNDS